MVTGKYVFQAKRENEHWNGFSANVCGDAFFIVFLLVFIYNEFVKQPGRKAIKGYLSARENSYKWNVSVCWVKKSAQD